MQHIWLPMNIQNTGSIPSWETKIPQVVGYSQKEKKKKKFFNVYRRQQVFLIIIVYKTENYKF